MKNRLGKIQEKLYQSLIYQRKFSCVNDVSMMIDVSIATVYSEVYFVYLLSFFSLFSGIPPSFVRRR